MAKHSTAVHDGPVTPGASPWERGREHWRDFRRKNDLSWPKSPLVNWTLGICVAILVAIGLFLAWFDWDRLRGPVARYASHATGRDVRIDGHLKVHLFSWTPSATVGGLKISNPRWAGPGDTAQIGQSMVQIRILPLIFGGKLDLTRVELDHPNLNLLKDAQGRESWNLNPNPDARAGKGPPIHTLVVRNGQLSYVDRKSRQSFAGRFTSADRASAEGPSGVFFDGTANLHQQPFHLTISGGPVVHLQRTRPYQFKAEVRGGTSHVTATGQLARPFDLNHVSGRLTVSGADLTNLYFLTGLALPNTPTYRLSGNFSRDGKRYAVRNLTGRVGDSDLNGSLSVDSTSGRPFLKGDLHSRTLVFEDLAALFGGGTTKASATPEQQAIASQMKAQQRILPDATLNVAKVRAMDGDVKYRAQTVRARYVPLRRIALHVRLDHGLLTLDPVSMDLTRGTVTGKVAINARGATPRTDLDLRASNIRVEDFMAKAGAEQAVTAPILARVRLSGSGNSVHAAAANANGGVTFVMTHGEVRKAFAELAGINAIKGLILLWSHNQDRTELRCAVAHFDVANGVMRSRRLVFDTGPVLIDGGGTVNLGSEALDLRLQGHTKKFRIGHLNAPVNIRGHLAAPSFKVDTGKIAAQGGLGLAVGVLLSPLAAILPFVDPGLAKDADCAGLVAEQASGKAPVKAVARGR